MKFITRTAPDARPLRRLGLATIMSAAGIGALTGGEKVTREIPDDPWVRNYFEGIDAITREAGEKSLRSVQPPDGMVELRVWMGFGLTGTNGLIVRRDAGVWSGYELRGATNRRGFEKREFKAGIDWESSWEAIRAGGVLTLPDFSRLPPDGVSVNDGASVVIETFADGKYRTVMYPNSGFHDHEEARQLEAIIARIWRAYFGVEVKLPQRSFLSDAEIVQLSESVARLQYPVNLKSFVEALPLNLKERGLHSHGESGNAQGVYKEWPLTTQVDQRGFFVLIATLDAKDLFRDRAGLDRVREAGVFFRNWIYDRSEKVLPARSPAEIRESSRP